MKKDPEKYDEKYDQLNTVLSDIRSDRKALEMKNYIQHGNVSTYEHCERVAKLSYDIDKKLSLNCNLNTLLRGAMLHDFFLYDWHDDDEGAHRLHGFTHADAACRNAEKYFKIDHDTSQVIYSHMWPLNISRLPASKEAWIVCLADKCVSVQETLFRRRNS